MSYPVREPRTTIVVGLKVRDVEEYTQLGKE